MFFYFVNQELGVLTFQSPFVNQVFVAAKKIFFQNTQTSFILLGLDIHVYEQVEGQPIQGQSIC